MTTTIVRHHRLTEHDQRRRFVLVLNRLERDIASELGIALHDIIMMEVEVHQRIDGRRRSILLHVRLTTLD